MSETTKKPEVGTDPRTAYMLAWRDRVIERLGEAVEGLEQECALLSSLLFCALSGRAGGEGSVTLSKAEVSEALAKWVASVEGGADGYTVRFALRAEEGRDGNGQEAG